MGCRKQRGVALNTIDKIKAAKKAFDKAKADAKAQGFCNVCEESLDECWCDDMADTVAMG